MVATEQRFISADSHVFEPPNLWWDHLADKWGEKLPRVINEFQGEKGEFFYNGIDDAVIELVSRQRVRDAKLDPKWQEAGTVPELRKVYQHEEGVDAEILNPTEGLTFLQTKNRDMLRDCCAVYNDWLADYCSHDPKSLIGTAIIPIEDVDWAAKELERTTAKGLKGAFINLEPPEGSPPYSNSYYDRFWSAAREIDAPITLHIGTGRIRTGLSLITPEERRDMPVGIIMSRAEVMWVLARDFIYGGILDRFPGLTLLCSEFEISWIPWFMNEMDRNMQRTWTITYGYPSPKMLPSEYMKTRVFHGFIDDPFISEIGPIVGIDRILWGSDFPHPEGIGLKARQTLDGILGGLSADDREKLTSTNAAALWGL